MQPDEGSPFDGVPPDELIQRSMVLARLQVLKLKRLEPRPVFF